MDHAKKTYRIRVPHGEHNVKKRAMMAKHRSSRRRSRCIQIFLQTRELPVRFWPKTDVSEYNSGRECCWPYLIGQRPLSPVFGQKRPGTTGNSYFTQLPPVCGHFMFRFWAFLCSFPVVYSNTPEQTVRTTNRKLSLQPTFPPKPFDQLEGLNAFRFFFKQKIFAHHVTWRSTKHLFKCSFQCADRPGSSEVIS